MDKTMYERFLRWGGDFPVPFESRSSSNNKVHSKYSGNGKMPVQNRVSHTVVRFLMAMRNAEEEITDNIAIGSTALGTVVEYFVSKNYEEQYQIAIRNSDSVIAFTVDSSTNKIEMYDESHSGMLIFLSLYEELMEDEEFNLYYNEFLQNMENGNEDEAWDNISILSDNIYRRCVQNDLVIDSINDNIDVGEISSLLASKTYVPTSVSLGKFSFLGANEVIPEKETVSVSDFIGKYPINAKRVFSEQEKQMIESDKIDETHIVSDIEIEICNDIVHTSNLKKPFRNFTLVGPPGTGKSETTKGVANGIVLPRIVFPCSPSTEIFDLTEQVLPPEMDDMERDAWDLAARIEEKGGVNFRNISEIYKLPNAFDIMAAPEDVYYDLTGSKTTPTGKTPNTNDAVKIWTEYMTDQFNNVIRKLKVSMKTGTGFRHAKAPALIAVEKGYTLEIQEPTLILQPGVLAGWNSVLEEGIFTLHSGEIIHRHKDSVIFFTTNHDLNGLKDMNQSFLDRSHEIFHVERPSANVVADRVQAITGVTDRQMVIEMVKLVENISNAMEKEGIDDGICGIRSIINWATKSTYKNPYDACISTVINKTSLDTKNVEKLKHLLDNSYFYQFKGK